MIFEHTLGMIMRYSTLWLLSDSILLEFPLISNVEKNSDESYHYTIVLTSGERCAQVR